MALHIRISAALITGMLHLCAAMSACMLSMCRKVQVGYAWYWQWHVAPSQLAVSRDKFPVNKSSCHILQNEKLPEIRCSQKWTHIKHASSQSLADTAHDLFVVMKLYCWHWLMQQLAVHTATKPARRRW
jgi:hypothetical protein